MRTETMLLERAVALAQQAGKACRETRNAEIAFLDDPRNYNIFAKLVLRNPAWTTDRVFNTAVLRIWGDEQFGDQLAVPDLVMFAHLAEEDQLCIDVEAGVLRALVPWVWPAAKDAAAEIIQLQRQMKQQHEEAIAAEKKTVVTLSTDTGDVTLPVVEGRLAGAYIREEQEKEAELQRELAAEQSAPPSAPVA